MTYVTNPFRFGAAWRRYVSSTLPAQVLSGNVTMSLPVGGVGQVMVAAIGFRSNAAFSMPAGWTQIDQVLSANTADGQPSSCLLAYKIRGASETDPVVFTRSGGNKANGLIVGYTPPAGEAALDTSASFTMPVAFSEINHPGVTVADPNSLVVAVSSLSNPEVDAVQLFAASLSAGQSSALVTPDVVNPVSKADWEWVAFSTTDSAGVACATYLHDVAGVPAGATGAITGYTAFSARVTTIVAAFKPVP
jgi:hypothetical protein